MGLFDRLHALEDKLSNYKTQLCGYEQELKKQQKRKSEIESIISRIQSVSAKRSDDVNTCLNKMINNYDDGLKGVSAVSILVSTTTSDKEGDSSADNCTGNAVYQLQSELSDIEKKISDLESKISTCKKQISSTNQSIKEEKRTIALELQAKYNNASSRYYRADQAYKADPSPENLKEYDNAYRALQNAKKEYEQYKAWL